jgi:peptide-methionine (S)-S-oxide reductase
MTEIALFGAGCFWGVQAEFDRIPGVVASRVGYAGGKRPSPTYEQVCSDVTGHAEVVELVFDPAVVAYADLVRAFFALHDPTQLNRQGPDIGSQYRSVIFCQHPEHQAAAQAILAEETASGHYRRPIVTAIEPATTFWPAEDYHQKYFEKRGGGQCHI